MMMVTMTAMTMTIAIHATIVDMILNRFLKATIMRGADQQVRAAPEK